MRAQDIIIKKRNGEELSAEEIRFFVRGYVDGSIPEYQVSAWLMAVFFRGMTGAETGIRFDDAAFGIEWPLPVTSISPKDQGWPDYLRPPTT